MLPLEILECEIVLYGLQDRLPVFCSLQTNLLPDDIGVLSLHTSSCFGFGLDAQKLVLVPQLHFMLYRRYKSHSIVSTRVNHRSEIFTASSRLSLYLFSWPPVSGRTPPVYEGFPHSGLAVENSSTVTGTSLALQFITIKKMTIIFC